jgi:hypothetical protein
MKRRLEQLEHPGKNSCAGSEARQRVRGLNTSKTRAMSQMALTRPSAEAVNDILQDFEMVFRDDHRDDGDKLEPVF